MEFLFDLKAKPWWMISALLVFIASALVGTGVGIDRTGALDAPLGDGGGSVAPLTTEPSVITIVNIEGEEADVQTFDLTPLIKLVQAIEANPDIDPGVIASTIDSIIDGMIGE